MIDMFRRARDLFAEYIDAPHIHVSKGTAVAVMGMSVVGQVV